MKRLSFLPLLLLLVGCLGGNPAAEHRSVFMQRNVICFSVNKSDVLNYYRISSVQDGKYHIITADEQLNLTYPDTCFKVKLTKGYKYNVAYGLNGIKYSDYFFIDNDGRL